MTLAQRSSGWEGVSWQWWADPSGGNLSRDGVAERTEEITDSKHTRNWFLFTLQPSCASWQSVNVEFCGQTWRRLAVFKVGNEILEDLVSDYNLVHTKPNLVGHMVFHLRSTNAFPPFHTEAFVVAVPFLPLSLGLSLAKHCPWKRHRLEAGIRFGSTSESFSPSSSHSVFHLMTCSAAVSHIITS